MTHIKTKIRKNDEVQIIAGKSKGLQGKVLQVKRLADGRVKVLVEGAHKVKKAIRPNPQKGEPGGIKEQEAFIDISNVQLYNSIEKRKERVGYRILPDGRKVRYFKKSGGLVDSDQVR